MKTLFSIFALLVFAGGLQAQSADKWPALKNFHEVMSQTFHPAEEGNLQPIKARSEELVNKAAALLKGDIPAEFRTNAILAAAEKLQLKSKNVHKLVVSKASDADITKALSEAHDVFHDIAGMCSEKR